MNDDFHNAMLAYVFGALVIMLVQLLFLLCLTMETYFIRWLNQWSFSKYLQ